MLLERAYTSPWQDIACQVRVKETGECGPVYGGRWSVLEQRYLEPWEILAQQMLAKTDSEKEAAQLTVKILGAHSKQASFIEDFQSPFIHGIGSRRSGKTSGGALKVVVHAATTPMANHQVVAPSYPKIEIAWQYLRQMIPVNWIVEVHKQPMWIRLFNGSLIRFVSAHNPDTVIGFGCADLFMDEVQSISDAAFGLALPALSDAGKGSMQAWAVGTPRMGMYRARYERLKLAPFVRTLHFTYKDNPYIHTGAGSIFDYAKQMVGHRQWQQEYEALFVAEEGLVYHAFDRGTHVKEYRTNVVGARDITSEHLEDQINAQAEWLIGVDYGMGNQHAVIYKILNYGGHVCVHAVDEISMDREASVSKLASELIDRGYYPAVVCDDASGPKSQGGRSAAIRLETNTYRDHLGHHKRAFDVFHYSKNPNVMDRVDAVNAMLLNAAGQTRMYIDPKCEKLIFALENQEVHGGKPKQQPRERTIPDDLIDAAGYPIAYLWPADVDYDKLAMEAA